MQTLVTVIHVFTCVLLVLVVLIQSGKGAEISSSFAGSSQTVFGTSGGANFFTRFTSGAAAVFMTTSVILTLMGGQSRKSLFDMSSSSTPVATSPAAAAPAAKDVPNPQPSGPVLGGSAPEQKAQGADAQKK